MNIATRLDEDDMERAENTTDNEADESVLDVGSKSATSIDDASIGKQCPLVLVEFCVVPGSESCKGVVAFHYFQSLFSISSSLESIRSISSFMLSLNADMSESVLFSYASSFLGM